MTDRSFFKRSIQTASTLKKETRKNQLRMAYASILDALSEIRGA